jgi:hypothetical protein
MWLELHDLQATQALRQAQQLLHQLLAATASM